MRSRIAFAALSIIFVVGAAGAGNWEQFRGPNGAGVAPKESVPAELEKHLLWKVKVPGLGNSSPVIWNDMLFLQAATTDGRERSLLCLHPKTGERIWERKFPGQPLDPKKKITHEKNSLASSTPATDGVAVYTAIWDAKDVILHAHTVKGEPMWEKNLGNFKSQHGPGGSPMIHRDNVYYVFDMDGVAVLHCFDKTTGKERWKMPREAFRASYSIPQILEKGVNGTELIVTSTTAITSYNPETGSQNWNWTWSWPASLKQPLRTIATSIETNGMLFACAGDGGGDRYMVALNLPGVVGAKPAQAWDNPKEFPYVPCLLSRGDNIYFVNDRGFAGCFDAKTGKKIWYERLAETACTASPILIGDKIYAGTEQGDVFVLAAEPTFKVLAVNALGERSLATPAVADGRFFVRGASSLFCYGK